MPINPQAKLVKNLFAKKIDQVPTRNGFGMGLVQAGKRDKRVVCLCADLAESTRCHWFQEEYPERYVELGVAEQNLATIAAGMANYGKIPFIASYATFSPGRNTEQIRTTVSLSELGVKIAGCHAGISVGPDGATHQALEDIALMRVQPNMTVLAPCDSEEAHKATYAAAFYDGPVYIRLARDKSPLFTTIKTPFEIGKAQVFWKGVDVTIIATGNLVYEALVAADKLSKQNISVEVINNHTIKPLDDKTIITSVRKTKAVVTVEEHQIMGGMGSAVIEMLAQKYPVPVEMIGIKDRFGESGEPAELLKKFGLTHAEIIKAVKKVIKRK